MNLNLVNKFNPPVSVGKSVRLFPLLEKLNLEKLNEEKMEESDSDSSDSESDNGDNSDENELELDIQLINKRDFPISLNSNVLIYGHVQSGKRNYIIQYAINCVNIGRHVFMFSDNVLDYKKFINETFINIFDEYDCDAEEYIIMNQKDEDFLFSLLTNGGPKIVLMLNNKTDATTVINIIKRLNATSIMVNSIFDESDKISTDGSKNTSKRSNLAQTIIAESHGSLLITATPFSNMWIKTQNDILGKDLFFIEPNVDYVDYESIRDNGKRTLRIKVKNQDEFCTRNIIEVNGKEKIEKVINYDGIKKFIGEFRSHTFTKKGKVNKYTVIGGFFNISTLKNTHSEIKDNLLMWYPNAYVVIVNGSVNKVFKNSINYGKPRESRKSFVGTMYEIQKKWKKTDKYLFVIGCAKMTRCVPLRAELPIKPKNCNEMLLITNMVYICSDTATDDIIVQQGQRLNGWYPDKKTVPSLKLFTTKRVKEILIKYRVEITKQFDAIKKDPNCTTLEGSSELSNEISKDKVFSSARGKMKKVYKNGKHYPTEESARKIVDNNNSSKTKENGKKTNSNVEEGILEVLKRIENENLSMTYSTIHELGNFLEKTTPASVSSRCGELCERGILKKEGNPYRYSLVKIIKKL